MTISTTKLQASVPAEVRELCQRLKEAGHRSWIVGGCVRDELMRAAGLAGTPAEMIPRFRALWRETDGLNATFFLRPDGRGKQRNFELFVREVWPALR